SEQFPKGGALTLNAMGGMGMIAVGVVGAPFLGTLQDHKLDQAVKAAEPVLYQQIVEPEQTNYFLTYHPLDKQKLAALPDASRSKVDAVIGENKQQTLAQFAVLPVLMAVGFGTLLIYFISKGGYRAESLDGMHDSGHGHSTVPSGVTTK